MFLAAWKPNPISLSPSGQAVGWFDTSSGAAYGIILENGVTATFNGTATAPCWFARYDTVQEGGNGNWTQTGYLAGMTANDSSSSYTTNTPQVVAKFTKFSSRNFNDGAFRDLYGLFVIRATDCEFWSAGCGVYDVMVELTNCFHFRIAPVSNGGTGTGFTMENCLVEGGNGNGLNINVAPLRIENSAFDGTSISAVNYSGTYCNYNAFLTNANTLPYPGTNDVILANGYNWQSSWFGNYYLPTNSPLTNAGDMTAAQAHLYDFTTQTNQVIQGTNIVDIGYHYVATDTNGNPLDTYIPGIPNYILDTNGDGNYLYLAIITEPTSQTNMQGSNATFSVTVEAVPPPIYQWFLNGAPLKDKGGISGSESATMTLNRVEPDQAGSYYVVVTNNFGSVTSTPALLTVLSSPSGFPWPQFILPADVYWNVTDISDPAQPVNIGELQAPFSTPNYNPTPPVPLNTLWHDMNVAITESYGTTAYGGSNGVGTVFSLGLAGQGLTLIHIFNGTNDGAYPCSQLAISGSTFYGISNILYGTTYSGGTNGYGTIFSVNADGTGFTNLYEFTGGSDGRNPQTGLLIDGNTLYGTTTNSIFKINTDGSDFTCLIITNGTSQLILSLSGDTLYGTISKGGYYGYGSVFRVNTDGSDFTNIYSFTGGTNGEYPDSGLELYGCSNLFNYGSTVSTLFGTTSRGGTNDYGIVFSINTDGTDFTNLHDFDGTNDGAYPEAELLLTNNNTSYSDSSQPSYLYGTTSSEGTNGGGTVFGMNLDGSNFHTLYSFGGTNGSDPEGKLVSTNQVLYGTTYSGGASNYGTVFSINFDGSCFTNLYNFSGGTNGASPQAGLVLPVADNYDSIWSLDTTINVSAGNVTNLSYSVAVDDSYALFVNGNLVSTNLTGVASWMPFASLPYVQAGENDIRVIIAGNDDGNDYFAMVVESTPGNTYVVSTNMFGTTHSGGLYYEGTVFELTPSGYQPNVHSFSGSPDDGGYPVGDLVLSGTNLYGVTEYGGTNSLGLNTYGSIFGICTNGSNYFILYSFTNTPDGANPMAGLIVCGNTLYGTTQGGGSNNPTAYGNGTIFSIHTDGSNYKCLYSFAAGGSDGSTPMAPLVLVGTNLYGTASTAGSTGGGTIFSICTNGSNYQTIYNFTNDLSGSMPNGLIASGGILYGTTQFGGTNNYAYGTVFSFNIGNTNYQLFHSFTTLDYDGYKPVAGLLLVGTTIYGTTGEGGVFDGGTIFSIDDDGYGYNVRYNLGSPDSQPYPSADLIFQNNLLYGTTVSGGTNGDGMVFTFNTTNADFNDIYDFMGPTDDGSSPEGGLCSP